MIDVVVRGLVCVKCVIVWKYWYLLLKIVSLFWVLCIIFSWGVILVYEDKNEVGFRIW